MTDQSHADQNSTAVDTDADRSSVAEALTEIIQTQQETIDRLKDRIEELEDNAEAQQGDDDV